MRYLFACNSEACQKEFDHHLPMSVVTTPQEPQVFCPHCGSLATRQITVGGGFILKGAGWTGKSITRKHQARKKSENLEVKQYERYGVDGGASMVPNYNGQIHDSWREVKAAAESDARKEGRPLDPMHEHMVYRENELKKVKTKDQVMVAKPSSVAKPSRVVKSAKKASSSS